MLEYTKYKNKVENSTKSPYTYTPNIRQQEEIADFIREFGGYNVYQKQFLDLVENGPLNPTGPPVGLRIGAQISEVREAAMLLARAIAVYLYTTGPDTCVDIAYDVAKTAGVVDKCHLRTNERVLEHLEFFKTLSIK